MRSSASKNLIKGIVLFEVLGLCGAYLLYFKMDMSQDFRDKMRRRFPSILEVYYKCNDWSGLYYKREADEQRWLQTKK